MIGKEELLKSIGVVRVVMGESYFSKFNKGKVLVAPMTRPEYLPLMKKACAVITDEGGVTCHAAVISREIGILYIVGTQKATLKLKDGMDVKVNADLGTVSIISHLSILSIQNLVDNELSADPDLLRFLQE